MTKAEKEAARDVTEAIAAAAHIMQLPAPLSRRWLSRLAEAVEVVLATDGLELTGEFVAEAAERIALEDMTLFVERHRARHDEMH